MTDLIKKDGMTSVFEEIDNGTLTGAAQPALAPDVQTGPPVAKAKAPAAAPSRAGQTAAPQLATLNPDTVNLLAQVLTLMAGKEARELQKQEQEIQSNKQREAQRSKNARGQEFERIAKQARCKHRKGGNQVKDSRWDYNVGTHTFPDGTCVISCLTCRAKWRKGDTVEYFLRAGRKISNHTKIGWREAVGMYNQSTNTASKSEIDPQILVPGAANREKASQEQDVHIDNQIRDLEGNIVENFVL